MDWQKCMNQAMEYIENNLTKKVDYDRVAAYMHCSEWEFRRVFSFLTQTALSEYVRNRRLTMAASDIQKGDKLLEVAQRYGYESQAAFSRAFSKRHGIAPSLVRNKEVTLHPCPPLNFKLVLMEGITVEKDPNQRTNIIGAGEVGDAFLKIILISSILFMALGGRQIWRGHLSASHPILKKVPCSW